MEQPLRRTPWKPPQEICEKALSSRMPNKEHIQGNFVRLKCHSPQIFHYQVSITPSVENKRVRMMIFHCLSAVLSNTKAYDGFNFCSPVMVDLLQHKVEFGADKNLFTIDLSFVEKLETTSLQALDLFNNLIRKIMTSELKLKKIGPKYFQPALAKVLPQHRLEVWPGYDISLNSHDDDMLLLKIDVCAKIVRKDTVWDYFLNLYANSQRNFREAALRDIVGRMVITSYNNETYRVVDILWDTRPIDVFETRGSRYCTYEDYFRLRYQIDIRDREQPLLKCVGDRKNSEPVNLVPELCHLTGLSEEERQDFHLVKDIRSVRLQSSKDRERAIQELLQQFRSSENVMEQLKIWSLSFDDSIFEFGAKVCPKQAIVFGNGSAYEVDEKSEWSGQLKNIKVFRTISLQRWLLVHSRRNDNEAGEFLRNFMRFGGNLGIDIQRPKIVEASGDRQMLQELEKHAPGNVLVIVILDNNNAGFYGSLKKLLAVDLGISSQCIVSKTLKKNAASIITKVALQICYKLGGAGWIMNVTNKFDDGMIAGVSTLKSPVNGKKIGGVCCTTDKAYTQYFSQTISANDPSSVADNIAAIFVSAAKEFRNVHESKDFPGKILVYRDGDNEADLEFISSVEIPRIKEALQSLKPNYFPKVLYAIVRRKNGTRFFTGEGANVIPGTVVDSGVTRLGFYDFYICSQMVNQGTASPSYYNIICDDIEMKPSALQLLTFRLCHLYANWCGTISVPAPIQYANKLCEYFKTPLSGKAPSQELGRLLHYL